LAFDAKDNLWVVAGETTPEAEEFTAKELKDLSKVANPTPSAVITSSTFDELLGCRFDKKGNL
jgi:hypothetical protein